MTKMVVVVGRGRKVVTVGTVIEGIVIVGSVDDTTVVTVMVEVTVSSVGDGVGGVVGGAVVAGVGGATTRVVATDLVYSAQPVGALLLPAPSTAVTRQRSRVECMWWANSPVATLPAFTVST